MSISQNIAINKYIKKISIFKEYISRKWQFSNSCKIYFPYRATFIHPAFDELKNNPPIRYSNKNDANILHLIGGGSKSELKKKHIIEIIDHAFSIIASYEMFPREPVEYKARQKKIEGLYLSERLKKLIFISNGQKDLARFYFPQKEIQDKSIVLPLPWKDNILDGQKNKKNNVNFLFIASNYFTKGVEILLKSWNKFKINDLSGATMTLVSHDLPKIELSDSINLYKDIPLNTNLKNNLYKNADVVLALALTDGIAAIEATSYDKPIVVFRTQHSKDFINNDNGIQIDVPVNVYDVDKYGIVWKTKQNFADIVRENIANGNFDQAVSSLVDVFAKYSNDRDFLNRQAENAVEKYYKDYTVDNRNKKLLEIYDEVM